MAHPTEALVARLRAAGCVFAEEEARILSDATDDPAHLATLVARRVAGEPLEVVVGWADFAGVRVRVDTGVFVPRQRTALLVDLAAAVLPAGGVLVDLCCGSGALGLAIAVRRTDVQVHAADIDPVAVACARRNLEPVGGTARVGDLDAPLPAHLRGTVDVLVANGPYVPTAAITLMPPESRDHEPRGTVDGGADGLDVVRPTALTSYDGSRRAHPAGSRPVARCSSRSATTRWRRPWPRSRPRDSRPGSTRTSSAARRRSRDDSARLFRQRLRSNPPPPSLVVWIPDSPRRSGQPSGDRPTWPSGSSCRVRAPSSPRRST
uniref:putative protein N(5)-glutamine methyltransferase n=1 Tax=Nocardioides stalactiti TaxID=2755356 RepID=UPI001FE4E316|nr:putative protein N(5)-glutamine methyltransferase [Nocardioides stalactiti]